MEALIQGLSGWQLGLKHHCKRRGYCQVPVYYFGLHYFYIQWETAWKLPPQRTGPFPFWSASPGFTWSPHGCGSEFSHGCILPVCSISQENGPVLAIPPCQAPSSEHKNKPMATINFCSDLWKSSAQSTQFNSQAKNLYSSWTVQSSLQDLLSRMEATSFKATVTLAQPRTFRIDVTAVQFLHLKHITTLRPPKSMRVLDWGHLPHPPQAISAHGYDFEFLACFPGFQDFQSLTCSLFAFSASSTLSLSPSDTFAVSSCTWASSFFLLCSDSALTCCSTFTSQASSLLSDSKPCLFFSRFALN